MPAQEIAQKVRTALNAVQKADLKDPRLVEVLNLSEQLVDAMGSFFGAIDKEVVGEIRYIGTYIARTRQEIAALRPNDIREQGIPTAGAELEAIVKHTEEATHTIMAAAEDMMMADPTSPEFANLVNERVMEIFQACSFQDITGQRVQKIVETLRHIESRIARFATVMGVEDAAGEESETDKRKKALLLNGPALNGPEVQQDAIDALFGDANTQASQDDIDALFN
jgi:chemotaxis protein CheZ